MKTVALLAVIFALGSNCFADSKADQYLSDMFRTNSAAWPVQNMITNSDLLAVANTRLFYPERTLIFNDALKLVRIKLRSEGKSILVRGKEDNVKTEMQPVVDALNATRYQGLVAAIYAVHGETGHPSQAVWQRWYDFYSNRSLAIAMALRPEFLSGKRLLPGKSMNPNFMLWALGVVEYNKFVEDYNKL